jgi:hypothetical protein
VHGTLELSLASGRQTALTLADRFAQSVKLQERNAYLEDLVRRLESEL